LISDLLSFSLPPPLSLSLSLGPPSLPLPSSCQLAVYIDEVSGSDSTGTGSSTSPFSSPSGALSFLSGRPGSLFWKKPVEQGQEVPKDQDSNGYTPISGAGLKKAKKAYEADLKKKAKAAEKEQMGDSKEKDVGVMDEQKLADSKKIVLEEPKEESKKVSVEGENLGLRGGEGREGYLSCSILTGRKALSVSLSSSEYLSIGNFLILTI